MHATTYRSRKDANRVFLRSTLQIVLLHTSCRYGIGTSYETRVDILYLFVLFSWSYDYVHVHKRNDLRLRLRLLAVLQ